MTDYPSAREELEKLGYPENDKNYDDIITVAERFYLLGVQDMYKLACDILGKQSSDASKRYVEDKEYFNPKDRVEQRFDFMAGATWITEQLNANNNYGR